MKESNAHKILKRYREGTLTEDEKTILESWYLSLANTQETEIGDEDLERHLDDIWNSFPDTVKPVTARRTGMAWPNWLAAASVLIACLLGAYWFHGITSVDLSAAQEKNTHEVDVLPGDNRAVLTLANGKRIPLEHAKEGEVAREKNITITKSRDGEIIYGRIMRPTALPQGTAEAIAFNTITTPKGGQFEVKLPDGTRVWLNAASSIRFPTLFSERVVEVSGEVYFEVAKKSSKAGGVPFKVIAKTQTIEVLGTRFNVNSYADESSIRTTLVEGSIMVRLAGDRKEELLLRPGQQAQLSYRRGRVAHGKQPFRVRTVNAQSVIAWKEGHFKFDNIGLPELMRQLSRWYDVQVVYEGQGGQHEFVGQIERNAKLSSVLQILEAGGVHFRLEGKKIIITDQPE